MSQYLREYWGAERGFPGRPVYAFGQTADGYLWIGTEKGLARFDGFNFATFPITSQGQPLPGPVLSLTTQADGNLWVRLQGSSVLRYREGNFENMMSDMLLNDAGVTAVAPGKDGGLLMATLSTGTVLHKDGKPTVLASIAALPRSLVIAMAQTSDGKIWMGTRSAGLFYLDGQRKPVTVSGLADQKVNCLLPLSDGGLWIGTDNGVLRWNGEAIVSQEVSALRRMQVLALARDRDGNIWIGTSEGLFRWNSQGLAADPGPDRTNFGAVTALFEDREGNLWVGGAQGIERLRDSAFVTYRATEGLPPLGAGPVYVDETGRAWVGPIEGGLRRLQGEKIQSVTQAGLDKDVVYSIAGRGHEVWLGRQRGGLTRLQDQGGRVVARTYTQAQGLAQNSVYAVYLDHEGAVWAGTLSGGLSRLKNGAFTSFTTSNGLAADTVNDIGETSDGVLWVATTGGLNSFAKDKWTTYKIADGLPSDEVISLFADSSEVLWLGTSAGLAFVRSGHIVAPQQLPDSLRAPILGMAEDGRGNLWVTTNSHVLQVKRGPLLDGGLQAADLREFTRADGLPSAEGVKRSRSVVSDSFARVWFALDRGLAVLTPSRIGGNAAPSLVHIESVQADGKAWPLRGDIRIPPQLRRLTFHYSGLSLAVPERVKYRYMLEGFDRGWSDPVSAREAVFTNLAAGHYRFRVVATNSDGEWNGNEASLAVQIEPEFWQTGWFRSTAALGGVGLVLLFYRLRLHQLTRRMNLRFEERLAERTRIAQELHDTLLQGFLSASLQLHVAVEHVPAESPARPRLTRILELMQQVIEEGRNAVRGLRSTAGDAGNLEQALARVPEELGSPGGVDFRIVAEGPPRLLHPMIRDEVYRVGREAVVNAFQHAQASLIEVEIEYSARQLRLLVRDNGAGIDEQVLRSGREGHWGLSGMRERAERIGAKLRVWSRAAAGTEVELSVPGEIAFVRGASRRGFSWRGASGPATGKGPEGKRGA